MAERRVRKPRVPRKRSSSHKNEQKLTAWSTTDDTSEDSCSSSSASEEFISFSPRRVKKKIETCYTSKAVSSIREARRRGFVNEVHFTTDRKW
mmetsp:Transcript_9093/g.10105  ORF Transcript_9093/g.10105 Transcript_9093/m.10105 type:complete len:93 (+) Transcript_9093:98-376(+)